MKDFKVALQLYSVREDMKADFEGTLKTVKEMGYDGVEFAGLFRKDAEEIRQLCEKYELIPISAHVPYEDMLKPGTLEAYQQIGCSYVVVPHVSAEYRPDGEKFYQLLEDMKVLSKRAQALGMKFGYHNHDFEFVKVEGQNGIDVIYRELGPELLQTQFDTCWVAVAGESPVAYIQKYADRAEVIHLKDYVGSKSENMYKLIGVVEEEKQTKGDFEFRPVGYGVQNFPAILDAAREVGTQWVVVEQDNPSMGKTAMECAKMSIDYLNSL